MQLTRMSGSALTALISSGEKEFFNLLFAQEDFSGLKLEGIRFYECEFRSCGFEAASLTKWRIDYCNFEQCNFYDSIWSETKILGSTFRGCGLRNALFFDTDISDCNFILSNLNSAQFFHSRIRLSRFPHTYLEDLYGKATMVAQCDISLANNSSILTLNYGNLKAAALGLYVTVGLRQVKDFREWLLNPAPENDDVFGAFTEKELRIFKSFLKLVAKHNLRFINGR